MLKMINKTKCRKPNMALHLNGVYKPNFGLEKLIFGPNPVFGREMEEKRGEELGLEEDQVLVRFLPLFLLFCDQATSK